MTRTVTAEVPFEDTLSELAHEIVGVAEPYIMAAYLYNNAIGSPEGADFAATMAFVNQWLPRIQVQDRPWATISWD